MLDTQSKRSFVSTRFSPATFYKWKKDLAIEQDEDKRRLRDLEKENARLKKMYAELSLEHGILKDGYEILNPARNPFGGKVSGPRRQEEMIDQITQRHSCSTRSCCRALGFRRQTYYRRKQGHRPEEVDEQIADLLRQTTKRFIALGFWLVFNFLDIAGTISEFIASEEPKSCIFA